MEPLTLPTGLAADRPTRLPDSRCYSIIGANGAGKSRFMARMMDSLQGEAISLSPVSEKFPAIPAPGLRQIISDLEAGELSPLFPEICRIWSNVFPGCRIRLSQRGKIKFYNSSGEDAVEIGRLSRGEKCCAYFLFSIALAPSRATLFIDTPTLFLHPTVYRTLWDAIESLRPDCRYIYDTSDPLFLNSRSRNTVIWIKSYRAEPEGWDYEIVDRRDNDGEINDDLMLELLGSRRPVLFIEGDQAHSIDARLYSLIFPEYTVKPVGSCNKVIEATRTFASLNRMHHLESHGIVDRDRRTSAEVEYLRFKGIMVPEVAEVENIFLSEEVVELMATVRRRNPRTILPKLRKEVFREFQRQLDAQALQHTRHRMKRDVERKIDARFTCITALELHVKGLIGQLKPREHFNMLRDLFLGLLKENNYRGILQVFNHKPLLTNSCVIPLLGFKTAQEYINATLSALHSQKPESRQLRGAIRELFLSENPLEVIPGEPVAGRKEAGTPQKHKISKKPKFNQYQSEHSADTDVRTIRDSTRGHHKSSKRRRRRNSWKSDKKK